nr:serine/threonine-protein phosphatase 6 regulatory ankyrin repeat subunit C-like isoform X2 [Pogona vitticeps]XP_020664475.1 serine/threonine-protein phosphatase 6 regulatory ankyrin repeat subunit C-like isoform X2 [Pogona vitticeps]XP_020664476.1 serine/threonine-protein phosphatase 6 regulatory ankyrin repeat subunit C-like isoform X2 [Pogona vitticeps]
MWTEGLCSSGKMGFYISSLSRAPYGNRVPPESSRPPAKRYQAAPSYNYRWTELHYEASRGNVEKLKQLLLTSGRELVDKKDYYGKTPLYWAAYKGQKHTVELLLQHGANVNTCCKHGGTPLHAAIGLFPDCTLLLIQHGADVNLQDNWGVTPMYLAACSGQTECIRLLVQAGACISYRNKAVTRCNCCREPACFPEPSYLHLPQVPVRSFYFFGTGGIVSFRSISCFIQSLEIIRANSGLPRVLLLSISHIMKWQTKHLFCSLEDGGGGITPH